VVKKTHLAAALHRAFSSKLFFMECGQAGYTLMNPNSNCLHMEVGWIHELNGNYF